MGPVPFDVLYFERICLDLTLVLFPQELSSITRDKYLAPLAWIGYVNFAVYFVDLLALVSAFVKVREEEVYKRHSGVRAHAMGKRLEVRSEE